MNSCEERKCRFWDGKICTDPDEWVEEQGEDCCRYQLGAEMKTSAFKKLQTDLGRLKKALRRYGHHDDPCNALEGECICGFEQVLEKGG